MEELRIVIDGKEFKVRVEETEDGKLRVYHGDEVFDVSTKEEIDPLLSEAFDKSEGEESKVVKAPLPGIIFSIDCKPGDKIKKGKRLLTMMAMKMENEVRSPSEGKVKEVKVKKGAKVNKGDVLVVLE